MFGWTDERVAELRRRWAAGETCSQIAVAMGGLSRSAVIGKVHRLGLDGRGGGHIVRRPAGKVAAELKRDMARLDPPKRSHLRKPDTEKRAPIRSAPPIVIDDTPLRCDPVDGPGVTLMDLTADTCHWPRGDVRDGGVTFCGGRAVDGKPYCLAHQRLATDRKPAPQLSEAERERRRVQGKKNVLRWRQGRGVTRHQTV